MILVTEASALQKHFFTKKWALWRSDDFSTIPSILDISSITAECSSGLSMMSSMTSCSLLHQLNILRRGYFLEMSQKGQSCVTLNATSNNVIDEISSPSYLAVDPSHDCGRLILKAAAMSVLASLREERLR